MPENGRWRRRPASSRVELTAISRRRVALRPLARGCCEGEIAKEPRRTHGDDGEQYRERKRCHTLRQRFCAQELLMVFLGGVASVVAGLSFCCCRNFFLPSVVVKLYFLFFSISKSVVFESHYLCQQKKTTAGKTANCQGVLVGTLCFFVEQFEYFSRSWGVFVSPRQSFRLQASQNLSPSCARPPAPSSPPPRRSPARPRRWPRASLGPPCRGSPPARRRRSACPPAASARAPSWTSSRAAAGWRAPSGGRKSWTGCACTRPFEKTDEGIKNQSAKWGPNGKAAMGQMGINLQLAHVIYPFSERRLREP